MSDSQSPQPQHAPDCRALFAQRPASQAWEVVTLPTNPPLQLLAWFKPAATPAAVMLQVPPPGVAMAFTVRQALHAIGINPAAVPTCSLFGFWFPGDGGASPHFDQPVSVRLRVGTPTSLRM